MMHKAKKEQGFILLFTMVIQVISYILGKLHNEDETKWTTINLVLCMQFYVLQANVSL